MISWIVLLPVAVAIIIFLVYKEWTRTRRAYLFGRLAASMIAAASLLFMYYPFSTGTKETAGTVILLTGGYRKDSLEVFRNRAGVKVPVFAALEDKNPSDSFQLVANWKSFAASHAGDTIHILGNGLTEATLNLLNPLPVVFHTLPEPSITHVYWQQYLHAGEQLRVQGHYANSSGKKIKVTLTAFGMSMDSFIVQPLADTDFILQTIPVHRGRAVYSLVVIAGDDTLHSEPVPVIVQPAAPLRLLIVAAFPDFENTYLKNYFSQQGYQVILKTVISSNKTSRQFLNMPLQQTMQLTAAYLATFDVLLSDEDALEQATGPELAAIRTAITQNGLGLLLRTGIPQKPGMFYNRIFPLRALHTPSSLLQLRGIADSTRYSLKQSDPVSIDLTAGSQPILEDAQSSVYAAARLYGKGKMIAITLQHTYSMALAGGSIAYQQLWSLLLNKASKKANVIASCQVQPFPPMVNYPALLLVEKDDTSQQVMINNTYVQLLPDAGLPFQWKGIYWPATAGWQELPVPGETANWYVYNTGDWKQLTAYSNALATKMYATKHPAGDINYVQQATGYRVNWKLLLLIFFLGSCTFLWVEQKLG